MFEGGKIGKKKKLSEGVKLMKKLSEENTVGGKNCPRCVKLDKTVSVVQKGTRMFSPLHLF